MATLRYADALNERYVQAALAEARKGRTTLVIAHRLATVLEADRIVVMDTGRVVEEGDHAALVARGGLYVRLAAMQFMDRLHPRRAERSAGLQFATHPKEI